MTDIITRLQLRAEQFSEGANKAFRELEQRADASSARVGAAYEETFSRVGAIAKQAQAALSAGGTGDLGAAATREAASAARQRADVLRQVATNLERTAAAERDASAATRLAVDSARTAAVQADIHARSLTTEAAALERVEFEMRQAAAAAGILDAKQEQAARSARNFGGSTAQVGQQVQDFFIQIQQGQSPTTAFLQQSSQMAIVMAGAGGAAGKFASILAGPWGLAVGGAIFVAGTFLESLVGLGDEHKEAAKAAKKHEDAARDLAKAQVDALRTQEETLKLTLRQTVAHYEEADGLVEATKKTLDLAVATERLNQAKAGGTFGSEAEQIAAEQDLARSQARVVELTALLDSQEANRSLMRDGALAARRRLDRYVSERSSTPQGQVDRKYERLLAGADRIADPAARDAEYQRLFKAREEERKSIQESTRTRSNANRETGRDFTINDMRAIVRSIGGNANGSGQRTRQRQSELYADYLAGRGPVAAPPGSSFHEAGKRGIALDIPKGGGVTLASIRKAFTDKGARVLELLDEGKHFHVAIARGAEAVRELSDETREAKAETRELDAAMAGLVDRFDPAAESARQYAKVLVDIDRLEAAGRFGKVDPLLGTKQGNDLRLRASIEQRAQDIRDAAAAADKLFPQAAEEWSKIIEAANDNWTAANIEAADAWADRVERTTGILGNLIGGKAGRGIAQLGSVVADDRRGFFREFGTDIQRLVGKNAKGEFKLSDQSASMIGNALRGAAYGSTASSMVLGNKGSNAGATVGGALGEAAFKKLAPELFKKLGDFAGPLGSIAGGLLGGVLGGLFKKTPSGAVAITNAGSTTSGKLGGQLSGAGKGVTAGLNQIIEQLGGEMGNFSVAVGKYGDEYRVSTSGNAYWASKKKTGSDIIYKGSDEGEAVRVAILDAIRDGGVKLTGAFANVAEAVLKGSSDLESALMKASLIQDIPKRMKARIDPVGAALDEFNKGWEKTIAALIEGGASAEQMAEAQKLYALELEDVKTNTKGASAELKDFLQSMKVGSNSPLSLRDQDAAARAALQPFLDKIGAGTAVDNAAYTKAAQAYLDVQRQMFGSTDKYFAEFDRIQQATSKAIERIDNAVPIRTEADPFIKATADHTKAAADLLAQISQQLAAGGMIPGLAAGGSAGSAGYMMAQPV